MLFQESITSTGVKSSCVAVLPNCQCLAATFTALLNCSPASGAATAALCAGAAVVSQA